MIRICIGICFFVLILGCDTEEANDCFQAAGDIVEVEVPVERFNRIHIFSDVRLVLKQGDEARVVLRTGENLVNDIDVKVNEGILSAYNGNRCNLTRDYGLTQLVVTAPNVVEIRNGSSLEVKSEGILSYPKLTLTSNTSLPGVEGLKKSGNFILDLATENLLIRTNGLSVFKLTGTADTLDVRFDDEAPRLEGRNLIVDHLKAFHRGANKMIVNPQQSIDAILTSTGDIISINKPPVVEVEQRYTGQLLFEN